MLVKMIRNKGNLTAGKSYNFDDKKATELLTEGYCVRLKEKPDLSTALPEVETTQETPTQNGEEAITKRKK